MSTLVGRYTFGAFIATVTALTLSLSSSIAGAQTVVRGPYLQNATETAVTVRWRTDVATSSRVRFGQTVGSLDQAESNAGSVTEHEVRIGGLSPKTKYFYAIGNAGGDFAGDDANHFFETSPARGERDPIRIWVLGDSGTANSDAEDVRDAYLSFANSDGPANFWIMLGDNAYSDGTDTEYQDAVFDMYPSVLRNKVLWSTLGNHDARTQDGSKSGPGMGYHYFRIFTFPEDGEAGGVASGTENYYSHDYGNVHFINLDANWRDGYGSDPDPNADMLTWARQDLMANDSDWVIAYWHHPPYSRGSHDDDTSVRENFLPVLEELGIDLVLTGHSHSYERSFLVDGVYDSSTPAPANIIDPTLGRREDQGPYEKVQGGNEGTVYVVAGSSGKKSGGSLDHPIMVSSLDELGSVVIDVHANELNMKFLRESGAVDDWFTMIKTDLPPPMGTGGTGGGGGTGGVVGTGGTRGGTGGVGGDDGGIIGVDSGVQNPTLNGTSSCGCRVHSQSTGEPAFGLLIVAWLLWRRSRS